MSRSQVAAKQIYSNGTRRKGSETYYYKMLNTLFICTQSHRKILHRPKQAAIQKSRIQETREANQQPKCCLTQVVDNGCFYYKPTVMGVEILQ